MLRWMVAVCRSFTPALSGLWHALKTQRNLQVHAGSSIIVILLGITLKIAAWEWCVVTLAAGSVWTAELLNSAIETLADRVSSQREEAIRQVKDIAAAAVLVAAGAAFVVGLIVFLPKLSQLM